MTTCKILNRCRVLPAVLVFLALSLVPVQADEFALFKGRITGTWKTTVVFGAAWRAANPQTDLVGLGNEAEFPGANGAVVVNDDANLNFLRGDLTSAPLTLLSDVNLRANNRTGLFIRVRAWYDMGLNAKSVHHGNGPNLYVPDAQLKDTEFTGSAKFQGADIYDAFWYGQFNPGSANLQLRVGRQAVNWGEGLLYPGINVVNPIDISWVALPGATIVNGGMLPVGRVYGNLAFQSGFSVDGFYNLEFRPHNYVGCGTWYSVVDPGFQPGCNVAILGTQPDRAGLANPGIQYYVGTLPAAGPFPEGGPSKPWAKDPERWNNFGVGGHYFLERVASELGVYYAHFTHPAAVINTIPGADPRDLGANTDWVPGVKAFAVSAASGIRNVALSGQVTRTLGTPLLRNFTTLVQGATTGDGPYANQRESRNLDQNYPGYFKGNTTQLQFGGTAQIGHLGWFNDTQVTAETNMQWITNHPGLEQERIGRSGNFGVGTWQGVCDDNGLNHCSTDGFATPFAWGYKLRAAAVLPRVSGLTFIPAVTFNQDLAGWGMEGSIQGRIAAGANLRVELRQRYFADLGMTWYRRGTPWDALRDRGLYTIDFGIHLQ